GLMTQTVPDERPGRRLGEILTASGIGMPLVSVSTNRLAGMVETLTAEPYQGRADLPDLAERLQMEADELFPAMETLQLLRFATMEQGDVHLTDVGRRFADSDVDARKRLFGQQLLAHVPLAALIGRVLEERPSHRAPFVRFSAELEDTMSEERAEETMRAIISWGRYGELFGYDEQTREFNLENP